MRRWLEQYEKKIDKGEIEWWLFVCLLTDGSDMAMCMLVRGLLAAWHWTVETTESLISPPTPMVLNIGRFFDKDIKEHRWGVQHWLEVYAHTLQQVGEFTEGRCWTLMGRDFVPRVLLLIEVFAGVLSMEIPRASAVSCWYSLPACIPHQRDEGALAHVISYLDEKATHKPTCKAWDELVWPPPSSAPPMPR